MTISVNFCVKNPKNYLNYHLSSFKVNENFTNQILKEVKKLTQKEAKKYSKIAKSFIATSISFLTLSSRSMAATTATTTTTRQTINMGLPTELTEPLMEMIKFAMGGSLLLTILLLIAAGVMIQFKKKKEGIEWNNLIIKGFIQILISTPLVFLLYYIVTTILGSNFTQFLNPF